MKWKTLSKIEFDNYEVSENGDVRNKSTGRIIKQVLNNRGYFDVNLCQNNKKSCFRVHRIVAETFLDRSDFSEVNHKNGIKTDNRLLNIEWVSRKENDNHARRLGLITGNIPVKVKTGNCETTFYSIREAAIYYKLHQTQLWRALKSGKPYKNIFNVSYLEYNAPKPEFREPVQK